MGVIIGDIGVLVMGCLFGVFGVLVFWCLVGELCLMPLYFAESHLWIGRIRLGQYDSTDAEVLLSHHATSDRRHPGS